MFKFISILCAALFVCGCGLKRTADNMEKSTDELKENSRYLKRDSELLGRRTVDLEQELTFKESSFMMITNLRYLFGEDELPKTAEALPTRDPDLPFYAGVVIKSMWFQFWKGDYEENLAALDERYELAAEILFVRATSYTPHFPQIDQTFPDRSWKAIGALGAKLDFMRPEYENAAHAAGLADPSFYALIVSALKVRSEIAPQVAFPKAVKKINEFAQVAEYMLQLRHNYLPAMVMSQITDFKDLGNLGKAWMKYVSGRKVDLRQFTPAQLREWTLWLNLAAKTREDLQAIGIKPIYTSVLLDFERGVDFGQRGYLAQKRESLSAIDQLRWDFASAYEKAARPEGGKL